MKIEISSTTIKKICVTAVFLLLLGVIGYMVYNHFDSKNDKEELASNINKAGTLSMFIIQE